MGKILTIFIFLIGVIGFLTAEDTNTSSKVEASPPKIKYIDYEKMKEKIKDYNITEVIQE
jgi:hypothetical protein